MLKVLCKTLEVFRDNYTKELYEAEGYTLEDSTIVTYEHRGKSWRDLKGNRYQPYPSKGEPEGFIRIA